MNALKGVLFYFLETGYEGPGWAFQDERHIVNGPNGEQWSYDGLHVLKDGDRLTVFDKNDPSKVVWQGVVRLDPPAPPAGTDAALDLRHADGRVVARTEWGEWFVREYPAELVPAP